MSITPFNHGLQVNESKDMMLLIRFKIIKSITLFILLSLLSCSTESNNSNDIIDLNTKGDSHEQENFKEEYFFDFDNIDHYFINPNDDHIYDLFEKDSLSELDKFYIKVLNKRKDTSISFIDSLEIIGFTKMKVDKQKIPVIRELFKSKYVEEIESTTCDPVYRDILVFKNDTNIVGVAKVCFACDKIVILGSVVPSDSFGQFGELYELEETLNK